MIACASFVFRRPVARALHSSGGGINRFQTNSTRYYVTGSESHTSVINFVQMTTTISLSIYAIYNNAVQKTNTYISEMNDVLGHDSALVRLILGRGQPGLMIIK